MPGRRQGDAMQLSDGKGVKAWTAFTPYQSKSLLAVASG
jgi:hypothetical protein